MAVETRKVYSSNLKSEFANIREQIMFGYSFVSIDTEFPGIVVSYSPIPGLPIDTEARYANLKQNVDQLKLIQVGITLSNEKGRLPVVGSSGKPAIWEFNLCDFNHLVDTQNEPSVNFLLGQGVDLVDNHKHGALIADFAEQLKSSGLIRHHLSLCLVSVTHITFHGLSDYAYLIKAITGNALPATLQTFLASVSQYFGNKVYDLKYLARAQGIHGGLKAVALHFHVEREGNAHNAGSDSLLTWRTFLRFCQDHFPKWKNVPLPHAGALFELAGLPEQPAEQPADA